MSARELFSGFADGLWESRWLAVFFTCVFLVLWRSLVWADASAAAEPCADVVAVAGAPCRRGAALVVDSGVGVCRCPVKP